MPIWGQIILGVAAVAGAVAFLWSKIVKPGAKLITTMDRLLPVATELTEQFHDAPEAFATLKVIAQQFKADSGTSLRDVINRLEVAANDNRASAEVLKVNVEAARQLAEQDRAQIARIIRKLDEANIGISSAAAGAADIATDLEASHIRAEEHDETSAPGQAADSAMRRPPGE